MKTIIDKLTGKKRKFESDSAASVNSDNDKFAGSNSGSDDNNIDNKSIQSLQGLTVIVALSVILLMLGGLILFIKFKGEREEEAVDRPPLKIELADKAIDGEHMLLKHYQGELKEAKEELNAGIKAVEQRSLAVKNEIIEELKIELATLREQLNAAGSELGETKEELRRMAEAGERDRLDHGATLRTANLDIQDFGDEVEYGIPKSAENYIPEGTYFTGNLLGGIAVSTALSTKDENPTTVTIKLTHRGNLAEENKLNVRDCTIAGSAYGDLAGERAIIRLEKMVCLEDGMYITSKIAGEVYGPDGLNGIKGQIVDTGSRHLKNAMLGGMISGFTSAAKGQESVSLVPGGLQVGQKKGFGDMAKGGLLGGVGNAGEKIADHYLRQAESLSPVLIIPGGVRVNPKINEGFFVGEIGTHRRIKSQRHDAAAVAGGHKNRNYGKAEDSDD